MEKEDKNIPCVCGSSEFFVTEGTVYSGKIDDDGVLQLHNGEAGGIINACCAVCGVKIEVENLAEINFN